MIEVKNVKKKFGKDFYANKGISLQAKERRNNWNFTVQMVQGKPHYSE